jgi:hypothetical protein
MREADILRSTLTDRVTVYRSDPKNPAAEAVAVYRDLPCALSRTAKVTDPDPHDPGRALAESEFRATLFLPAGTWTSVGDRAEVLRDGSRFSGVLSASAPYPSYAVAVLRVWEVSRA